MKSTSLARRLPIGLILFFTIYFFVFALLPNGVHAGELSSLDANRKQMLTEQITNIANEHNLIGLQVSINHKNGGLLTFNHGFASIEKSKNVDRNTVFRAGSISKTIAAIAIMQLVEKKEINLNSTVRQLAPEIHIDNPWQKEQPVTVLHLLEHTAGFDDIHFKEDAVDGSKMTTKEALEFYPDTRRVRYQPGQFMSYTNIGPTIIAYLIEKMSGMTYEQYVQHHIFKPLGMSDAGFHLTSQVLASLASGYIVNEKDKSLVAYQHLKDRASGALNASSSDLSKIQRMLLGYAETNSTLVLTDKSIKYLSTIETTLAAKEGYQIGYGKYLISVLTKGIIWTGHVGEMNGYLSEMWHSNDKQTGFVLLTNSNGDKAKQGVQKIKQLLKSFIVENIAANKTSNSQPSYANKPILDIKKVVGSYRQYTSRLSRLTFFEVLETYSTVYIESDKLKLKTPNSTYTLTPIGGKVFRTKLKEGHEIDIIFAEADGVWYYQIPRLFINATKTSSLLKPLSFTLLIAFFTSILIIAITFTIQFLRRLKSKPVIKTKSLKWFMLSPLFLIGVIICLGSAGNSGMPKLILGQTTIQSLGVTIGLLLFLASSFIAHYYYWSADKPELVQNNKIFHLVFVTYFALVNLAMLLTMIWLDFVFVAFWY